MHECSVHGKRPALTSFIGRAEENFECRDDCTTTQNVRELAWFLLRLNRKNVLKANDTYGEQSVSGWSAFNAEMSSITLPRTIIVYCPMIAGSPTEYSTIYTVLKTVQEMSKHLQQNTAVITFDLAIYSKAKEIHWRYPEDVFIESGLYGSNSTMALLQGKSYKRGIRGHKLIMEALLRLKWDAFCSWVSKGGGEEVESEGGPILNLVDSVIERYRTATTAEEKKEAYLLLCNTANRVEDLLTRFKQETSSKLFKF